MPYESGRTTYPNSASCFCDHEASSKFGSESGGSERGSDVYKDTTSKVVESKIRIRIRRITKWIRKRLSYLLTKIQQAKL